MKLNTLPKQSLLAASSLLLVSTMSTQAAVIYSDSFDSPVLTSDTNGFNGDTTAISGWTILGQQGGIEHAFTNSPTQAAYIYLNKMGSGSGAIETTGNIGTFAATTYTLSVELGNYTANDTDSGSYTVYLLDTTTNMVANSAMVAGSSIAGNTYAPLSFTYTPTVSAVGDSFKIEVAFAGSSTNAGFMDNVQLSTATVPEPSTWAMMMGGLCLLLILVRRRNLA